MVTFTTWQQQNKTNFKFTEKSQTLIPIHKPSTKWIIKNQTHFSVYSKLSNTQSPRPMYSILKKKYIKRFQLGSNWGSIIEYNVFIEDIVESLTSGKIIWRHKVLIHNLENIRKEIALQLNVTFIHTYKLYSTEDMSHAYCY